ncbi:MAG: sensor histidine kinase [Egibacteraceae bacterium]
MRWAQRVRAWLEALPTWVVDGVIALSAFGADLWFIWMFNGPPPEPGWPTWLSVNGSLLSTLPLIVRRRYPRAVLGVVAVTAVAGTVLGVMRPASVTGFGLLVAVFTVAARWSGRGSLVALGSLAVIKALAELWRGLPQMVPLHLLSYVVAWVIGHSQLTLRALVGQLQRERENKARLAVADERARIARDLHDVVAHSVSVMVLHTAVARRTLAKDPARAGEALAQVEATGRQSLVELRRLLGVLREDGQGADLAPQPQLAYLDDLVGRFHDAGLPVRVEVTGEPQPLAAGVDLSAYRIVQEALTNALKHANASTVEVRLRYTERDLQVEVVDDGCGITAEGWCLGDGAGHGLVGMRERAALVGGRLEASPRPEGGFRVGAVLPLGS